MNSNNFKSVVPAVDLDKILQTAALKVKGEYQAFRFIHGQNETMMEVGLTDKFVTMAKATAMAYNLDFEIEQVNEENVNGSDFKVTVNNHQGPQWQGGPKNYFFQAKIAKADGYNNEYADFLYKSTKGKAGGQSIINYQNVLLHDWALHNNGEGYYVVYDSAGVKWVNARNLKQYFEGFKSSEPKVSEVEWCVRAFEALAKDTFLEAKNQIFNL